jgi:hypothetical protein
MMKALTQTVNQSEKSKAQAIQELKNVTMTNSRDIHDLKSYVAEIEGQIDHLVTELNRIEEKELQSQLVIERHYMSDEDDSKNSCHEQAQVTTTIEGDEVVDNEEEQVKHN